MPSSPAIDVVHVSKCFKIQKTRNRQDTLYSQLASFLTRRSKDTSPVVDHWALNDVSFSVNEGEMLGIIGRNGAGKSTLLKILSRITPPTQGSVRVRGRIATLLEVGTGFHGELSGRENIFLNGAILGMSRSEIRAKFDQIVAFSGVDKFIDTPVKRYSSGMYVRLAFSVAAHLDPDILIVDEVLAVGDVAFQRKCADTMRQSAKGNRTVLFVSHNLQAIRTLCSRVILLDGGKVVMDGAPEEVLNRYVSMLREPRDLTSAGVANRLNRCNGKARFRSFRIFDTSGNERYTFKTGESFKIQMQVRVNEEVPGMGVYVVFRSALTGDDVTSIVRPVWDAPLFPGQECQIEVDIPEVPLRAGDYLFYVCVGEQEWGKWYDVVDENVQLPILTVGTDDRNTLNSVGVFTMPAKTHFQLLDSFEPMNPTETFLSRT